MPHMTEHIISVCKKFEPDGTGGGCCSIHGSQPQKCKDFFCSRAIARTAKGQQPCEGCTIIEMLNQGCCNNNLGFGTKKIEISRPYKEPDPNSKTFILTDLANQILKGAMTSEGAREITDKNGWF